MYLLIEEQVAGLLELIKGGIIVVMVCAGIGLPTAILVIIHVVRRTIFESIKEGQIK